MISSVHKYLRTGFVISSSIALFLILKLIFKTYSVSLFIALFNNYVFNCHISIFHDSVKETGLTSRSHSGSHTPSTTTDF